MQTGNADVIAICLADLHFSHQQPSARAESDWYAAQERMLLQVYKLANQYKAPQIWAGDIFHTAREPASIVNFLLRTMPTENIVVGLPGNHELNGHRYSDVDKSPYKTLVEAGRLLDLVPGKPLAIGTMRLHGFPFGFEVKPLQDRHSLCLEIAVIHSFIWIEGAGHKEATTVQHLTSWKDRLAGYDVAVFGDNHQPVDAKVGDCIVFNCGGFLRRRMDEKEYAPSVGLLHGDGTITRHYLDVSQDKFADAKASKATVTAGIGVSGFVEEAEALPFDRGLDFEDALRRRTDADNELSDDAKFIVFRCLESSKGAIR